MSRLRSPQALALVVLLGSLGAAAPAHAQVSASEKAAAESLFDRGLALMRDGKLEQACQSLEQSQSIERGLGTMLYLAECYEKLGRTASAWALFREAASQARAAGQTARADAGASRAAALEPKLSKLTVQVDPENLVPGFELLRDGQPVSRGLFGVAVPVDPGEHRLEARAPGRLPWTGVQRVGADADAATVTVPKLALDPSAVATPSEPPPAAPASLELGATGTPERPTNVRRTAGLVAGGVGLVALGVGGFFGVRAINKNNEAKDNGCSGSSCNDLDGKELTDQAMTAATLANVFVIGGAAIAATGVVLYLTAPSDDTPSAAVASDGRSVRVQLGGVF